MHTRVDVLMRSVEALQIAQDLANDLKRAALDALPGHHR